MAPISDKRASPQPHIKDGGHTYHSHGHGHMHTHTKENTSSHQHHSHHSHHQHRQHSKHSKKGLEILDFHESWLEEMEIYKDQMYVQKHQQQQLLGVHNHGHSTQGGPLESYKTISTNSHSNSHNLTHNPTTKSYESKILNSNEKRRLSDHVNNISKSRIIVRNAQGVVASAATATAAATALASMKHHGHATRPREEHSSSKSGAAHSSKRHSHTHPHPHTHVQTHSHSHSYQHQHQHQHQHPHTHSHSHSHSHSHPHPTSHSHQHVHSNTSPLLGHHAEKCAKVAMPPLSGSPICGKPATKIIVNQFHASSLLNAHHRDEKTKILTQNGLTKSAATAYETSLYASNYLPQDRMGNIHHGIKSSRPHYGDHTNYVGVSLAKHDSDRHRGPEDDPCAAIDDVNDYSDSETDEEYTGYPFYLEEDANETHQSRNIRYKHSDPDIVSSEESETDRSDYYRPKAILSPSIFPNVPPYLNFSSHADKGPPMPPTLHRVLKWKLSPVMPKIVKRVVLNSGFRIIKNTTDWMAIWEKHMKSPGFRTIRSHQKYNHMPGSFRIGRKDSMWRSIYSNMKKFGTKEFGFMQKSYIMPEDLENLRQVWPKNASRLTKWIVKPPASARGTGIRIVNKWSQFPKDRPLVVQKYIERPLLINDNKFDMRIYVVVTSINPLRIYMYKDGLARFASVKYSSELNCLDDRCMHLTNYSINKFSQNYSKNEDFNACQGHKWTLQSLWSCLENRGVNTKRLWATLRNLVVKAIISGESGLNRMYRQNVNFRYNCFELFGFDVLLDENLIPWLLEINISPSLHSELPLDLHVKGPLIQAVLNTALYQVPPKLNEKQQKDILDELMLSGPLCHDKRIFTTCLTAEEVRKHNQFTNRSIEYREEYIDSILENLLPDDVRCLIITEDEFARSKPLERIFPTPGTHMYLKFIDNPRYYNRLLDAWEHRYGHCREEGIAMLRKYCEDGYHLQVSDAAMEKEPNVTLTEIDMLHAKKSEDPLGGDDKTVVDDKPVPLSKYGESKHNDADETSKTDQAGALARPIIIDAN